MKKATGARKDGNMRMVILEIWYTVVLGHVSPVLSQNKWWENELLASKVHIVC